MTGEEIGIAAATGAVVTACGIMYRRHKAARKNSELPLIAPEAQPVSLPVQPALAAPALPAASNDADVTNDLIKAAAKEQYEKEHRRGDLAPHDRKTRITATSQRATRFLREKNLPVPDDLTVRVVLALGLKKD